MKEEKPKEKKVKEKKIKEKKVKAPKKVKPKKKTGVYIASLCLGIIVCFLIWIGLLKLIDYLQEPSTIFNAILSQSQSDFNEIMNKYMQNDLYQIFENDIEISSSVNIEMTNFNYSSYAEYSSVVNETEYQVSSKFSKNNNYYSMSVLSNYNENTKTNLLVYDGYRSYTKYDDTLNRYQKDDSLNLVFTNIVENIDIVNLIYQELANIVPLDGLTTLEEDITVNDILVSAEANSFSISANEFESLLNNIVNDLMQNEETKSYLENIFGLDEEELYTRLYEIIENQNILEGNNYTFASYSGAEDGEALKLTITSGEKVIFVYESLDSYIKWHLNFNDFEILITDSNEELYFEFSDSEEIFVYSILSDNAVNFSLVSKEDEIELFGGSFTYSIEETSEAVKTINTSLLLNVFNEVETGLIKFEITSLVTNMLALQKESTSNYRSVSNAFDIHDFLTAVFETHIEDENISSSDEEIEEEEVAEESDEDQETLEVE